MKKIILGCFLLSFSQVVMAFKFSSSVHSIDMGKAKQSHLVRFNNGRVCFVKASDSQLINSLVDSEARQETVEVKVDTDNTLFSIQTVETPKFTPQEEHFSTEPFEPSIVKNFNAALAIQNKMRKDYRAASQCYSRAHIWAYEEHKRSHLNLMKIFMFFTERYIRKYKFHWWFHVTPMVYVGNKNTPRTLDRRYTSGPRQTKIWSNTFVKSKRTCPVIKKFDDFWLNQHKEDCYHIYSSMYYVIPRDLEKRDLDGIEKTDFVKKEIKKAYKDGFNRK